MTRRPSRARRRRAFAIAFARAVVEDSSKGIVRRDDEIEFAFLRQPFESGTDVQDAPRLEPLGKRLPLGCVLAQSHLDEVSPGCEHARSRAPDVPAEPR